MNFHIMSCNPDAHAAAVREIFNDAILNTTALYDYKPWTEVDVLKWFRSKAKPVTQCYGSGSGWFAAGFASYGQFRVRPAYKYTRTLRLCAPGPAAARRQAAC
jgi:phosphinothricin acetyltransferase